MTILDMGGGFFDSHCTTRFRSDAKINDLGSSLSEIQGHSLALQMPFN